MIITCECGNKFNNETVKSCPICSYNGTSQLPPLCKNKKGNYTFKYKKLSPSKLRKRNESIVSKEVFNFRVGMVRDLKKLSTSQIKSDYVKSRMIRG